MRMGSASGPLDFRAAPLFAAFHPSELFAFNGKIGCSRPTADLHHPPVDKNFRLTQRLRRMLAPGCRVHEEVQRTRFGTETDKG
jgi:hypothetical protein